MPGPFVSYGLSNCCLCVSLKTGCRIIGSLTAFVCTYKLISTCHQLVQILENKEICMDVDFLSLAHIAACSEKKTVQLQLIVDLIIHVIGFNGSVLLFYGIKSKRPKLFLPWMVFCGMLIFSKIFDFLRWHSIGFMSNIFLVFIMLYCFKVVRSYHLRLHEEINGGGPVVAVAFPSESNAHVFEPPQRGYTASDYIKDEPPPYPGLPFVSSPFAYDSQPPPYSVVNPNYESLLVDNEPSTSANSQTPALESASSPMTLERTPPHEISGQVSDFTMEPEESPLSSAHSHNSPTASVSDEDVSVPGVHPCTPPAFEIQSISLHQSLRASGELVENQVDTTSLSESLTNVQVDDQESFKSVCSISQSIASTPEASEGKDSS